jgi:uncharacterized protein
MGYSPDPSLARPIDRVNDDGFAIAGMSLKGPMIVLNGKVIMWDVSQWAVGGPTIENEELGGEKIEGGIFEGWTTDVLKVFEVLEGPPGGWTLCLVDEFGESSSERQPSPTEFLVFGTGAEFSPLPNILRSKLHALGIQLEIQKTVGSTNLTPAFKTLTWMNMLPTENSSINIQRPNLRRPLRRLCLVTHHPNLGPNRTASGRVPKQAEMNY